MSGLEALEVGLLNSKYHSSTLSPFYFGVSLLKLKSREKGTLLINGLLGNLDLPSAQNFEMRILRCAEQGNLDSPSTQNFEMRMFRVWVLGFRLRRFCVLA